MNSSEEPDKSAIKKEEKEYTRAGMAGINFCVKFVDIVTREAVVQHLEKLAMCATNKITL